MDRFQNECPCMPIFERLSKEGGQGVASKMGRKPEEGGALLEEGRRSLKEEGVVNCAAEDTKGGGIRFPSLQRQSQVPQPADTCLTCDVPDGRVKSNPTHS